jgi:hypothetical protein
VSACNSPLLLGALCICWIKSIKQFSVWQNWLTHLLTWILCLHSGRFGDFWSACLTRLDIFEFLFVAEYGRFLVRLARWWKLHALPITDPSYWLWCCLCWCVCHCVCLGGHDPADIWSLLTWNWLLYYLECVCYLWVISIPWISAICALVIWLADLISVLELATLHVFEVDRLSFWMLDAFWLSLILSDVSSIATFLWVFTHFWLLMDVGNHLDTLWTH